MANSMKNYDELPLFLTVEELANVLGIGRNTAYTMVRTNQIANVRVGNQYRIPKSALLSL